MSEAWAAAHRIMLGTAQPDDAGTVRRYLSAAYGASAPADLDLACQWVLADRAAAAATGLYADQQQWRAVSSHPWPYLLRAFDRHAGVELTADQVREMVKDYDTVVEKANGVTRTEWINRALAELEVDRE